MFTPKTAGVRSATLLLSEEFKGSAITFEQSIFLAGTAPPAALTMSSTVSFSNQALGITGSTRSLTIYNNNLIPITVTSAALEQAGDFAIVGNTCGVIVAQGSCTIGVTFTPLLSGTRTAVLKVYDSGANSPHAVSLSGQGNASALEFVPIVPCRVSDTRNSVGPFGGPELSAKSSRDFTIPSSSCNVPFTAVAYSLNVTVVPDAVLGYLAIWPAGQPRPLVSTLNSDGRIKANAVIVAAGSNKAVSVYVSHASHVILDINGYFVPTHSSGLLFYPVTPCRVADTRQKSGSFGAPYLTAGQTRSFPVTSSACQVPTTAQAYAVNVTSVPHGPLWFLAVFPTGETLPLISTLNAPTGTTTANAAIVAAGTGGSISFYASNDTDLILDITGYFAPASSGGLSFYPTAPCRALDTRIPGPIGAFMGIAEIDLSNSGCLASGTAQTVVTNATVVPFGPLGYLSLWPSQEPQPYVSTLNAVDTSTTSNLALVSTTNNAIDSYASSLTNLILDVSGYFAF